MASAAELERQFGIEGVLRFDESPGGLARAVITAPAAEAGVYLQGAHVARWTPRGQRPGLFLSSRSQFVPGKAIRGGVPVIFPWFGPRGGDLPGPSHGFARTLPWTLDTAEPTADGGAMLRFSLAPNGLTTGFGYAAFRLVFQVILGEALAMELEIFNDSTEPLIVEQALHTYLAIGDVRQVAVHGLEGTAYIDKTDGGRRKQQPDEPLRLTKETDQVHLDTESACTVEDPVWQRRLVIEKTGSRSTVVWNPWTDKTAAFTDMAPDEWPGMVCIETANAADNAVTVHAGAVHRMTAVVRVEGF